VGTKALLEAETEEDLTAAGNDDRLLPKATMDEIKKLLVQGAKPNKEGNYENWSNALHMVHKAYQVAGVQRPTPDMEELWKQYEQNIEIAVKELSKQRGIGANWRMTAHELHK
jgi:hypothetical protein